MNCLLKEAQLVPCALVEETEGGNHMIALMILLALGVVSLWAVCMCKAAGEVDRYMEELERGGEHETDTV